MPWTFAIFGRSRAITSSALAFRAGLSLSAMNIVPVLTVDEPKPPTLEIT
jgi:hypothetical protein